MGSFCAKNLASISSARASENCAIGVAGNETAKEPWSVKYCFACLFALVVTPALAVDPTGIPQCDALLKRYEACSSLLSPKQVHAAQKELLDGAMGMRAVANDPTKRADLERYCTDTFEQMKKSSDIKECMSKP
jgi:hypothetical protein